MSKPVAFLGEDLANVVAQTAPLFLKALDPLDNGSPVSVGVPTGQPVNGWFKHAETSLWFASKVREIEFRWVPELGYRYDLSSITGEGGYAFRMSRVDAKTGRSEPVKLAGWDRCKG